MANQVEHTLDVQDAHFQVDPRFTDLRPIAYGGNGIIYSATDSDCDKAVAIKKLCFTDRKSCKYVLREIRIMRRLQHENIVTVYEVLGPTGYGLDRGLSVNDWKSLYLVQELLDTDLSQLIQQEVLTNEHIRLFLYQLLRGLKYIHSANVVHRDLKPANLLINLEDMVLKIGDFGLARVVDTEYSHKGFLTDGVGTCWYRSPELIVSPRDYTKAIDIWGVGCIFAEMLIGKPLFPGGNEMDQVGQIIDTTSLNDNEWNTLTQVLPNSVLKRRSKIPKHPLRSRVRDCDASAIDLLEKLLVFSPGNRLTAEESLAHPYLQKYSSPDEEPTVIKSFHIEHEADDMSPKTLRRMISEESTDKVDLCGSHVEDILSCRGSNKTIKDGKSSSESSLNQINSGNTGIELHSVGNSRESLTEIEIVSSSGENISTSNSSESLFIDEHFQKELSIIVDLPDEENKKEEMSPKEDKSESEKEREKKVVKNVVTEIELSQSLSEKTKSHGSKQTTKNFTCPKVKDRINEEKRAESPRENLPTEKIGKSHKAKGDLGSNEILLSGRNKGSKEKSRTENSKIEKMKKNKNNKYSDEAIAKNQDFDSMYRLPTEHLTRPRNSRHDRMLHIPATKVEEQLKLHEQLNEKLKLAELDKDKWTCCGAVGGKVNSPCSEVMREEVSGGTMVEGLRSRSGSGSSGSNQDPSREGSPSCELPQRRFEH